MDLMRIKSYVDGLKKEKELNKGLSNEEKLDMILKKSIVTLDQAQDDTFGKDMQEIAKELTDDRNTYRFSNMISMFVANDSMIGAVADVPYWNRKEMLGRYFIANRFRYHYHVNRASIRSGMADRYCSLAGNLIGFQGMLAYREAGVSEMEDGKKRSIIDRIRGK